MATRAPSLSNSCAAASPIPLLPPVIRIFLPASLPIVVTPSDYTHPCRLQFLANFPHHLRRLPLAQVPALRPIFPRGMPRGKTGKKRTDHELPKPDIFTS